MIRRTFLMTAAAATIALGVSSWSNAIAGSENRADIVDTAVAAGSFNTRGEWFWTRPS